MSSSMSSFNNKRGAKMSIKKKSETNKKPYGGASGGGEHSVLRTALEKNKPSKLMDGDVIINLITEDDEGHQERTTTTTANNNNMNELDDFLKEYEGIVSHVYAPQVRAIPPPHDQEHQQQQQLSHHQYPVQILEHIIIPAPPPPPPPQSNQHAGDGLHQFHPPPPGNNAVNNNHFQASLPRAGAKDMNVLRDIYQNISPAAATDLPPPPPPPPLDPHRWHEPSNPQELAMVSMRCLEQMLPIVETKHRDSQLLTERLERELTASRTQQQHLQKEMQLIINYITFLKQMSM
ncbi:formin-like protein 3 [Photinus pyralis]|uniref:formin-like protein 3 n=1 Tax=Photinus pyralis TaxID=7054 RepID=UPI0012671C35|nr:formin-like protein 3 [Photinus pyralis]